jgi:hydrogenase nickel incorporation protein HypA/HybF
MHEWALADAVVAAASSALAGRDPSFLRTVTVRVGELQAIDHEILQFALSSLAEEFRFADAVFILETEPAVLLCAGCGREWGLAETQGLTADMREAIHFLPEAAHAFVRCPGCGSPDYRVQEGRGVSIKEIGVRDAAGCA